MNIINIFIAGSKKLSDVRDNIRAMCMNLNNELRIKYSAISYIETYETLPNHIMDNGQQSIYNNYIRSKADIVIFILRESCGDITKEEFMVAYEGYIRKKRPPKIYVFKMSSDIVDASVSMMEELLNEIHQYYIEYKTDIELAEKIRKEVSDYAWQLKLRKKRKIVLILGCIVTCLIILLAHIYSAKILYTAAFLVEKIGQVEAAGMYYYKSGIKYFKSNQSIAYDCFYQASLCKSLEAALELNKGADSLMRLGDYNKAYKYYILLLELEIVDEYPAGLCLYKSGKKEEGIDFIRKAANKGNDNAIRLMDIFLSEP